MTAARMRRHKRKMEKLAEKEAKAKAKADAVLPENVTPIRASKKRAV